MNQQNTIAIFQSKDGGLELQVSLDKETVCLSLNQLSELFGRDKSAISKHLANIFKSNELDRKSVVAKNATTAADGKIYQVDYYNLDAIISVGYRINSLQARKFRIMV
ncbi:RhuM family protein [Fluoribacter gormanii]|uniref:RhuM family protein n=1 Tax=Fluoribacter gormanii TaxID=464 RepID=UPI001A940DC0|nr:RhuM family protein [Fluoribacter gormanii]